jgi:hypothetical protein
MPVEFDLDEIVHHARDLTAGYHLLVARAWRIIGEQDKLHSPLAYSAFEFRCCIERVLVELFVLVRDKKVSRIDERMMNSIGNIRKAIYRICGGKDRFGRIQTFNRLYSQGEGSPPQLWIAEVDIDQLEKFWSSLSEYCHRQLRPLDTWKSKGDRWQKDGYRLLNEVEQYLWEIMVTSHVGWVQPSTMQPEMLTAFNEFVSGKLSLGALKTRLAIMGPIIKKRIHGRY